MRIFVLQGNTLHDFHTGEPVTMEYASSAVTIGSFDGIHVGHRKIIDTMIDHARSSGLRSVVVTFEPHPRLVLDSSVPCPVKLLTTLDEKIARFGTMPIDLLFVIRFDRQFSMKSSDSFIREVLVSLLGSKQVTVGYDHGFGSDRSGSGQTLRQLGAECGFELDVVSEVIIDQAPVSSTRIRKLLEEGRIMEANACLGAQYPVSGRVIEGRKLGRGIGFPTANIDIPQERCKMLPAQGVYAAGVTIDGVFFSAMMNIGSRPTVSNDGVITVEAHIIGFQGDIYGRNLVFHLFDFIRSERRFSSIEELGRQLHLDKKQAGLYKN